MSINTDPPPSFQPFLDVVRHFDSATRCWASVCTYGATVESLFLLGVQKAASHGAVGCDLQTLSWTNLLHWCFADLARSVTFGPDSRSLGNADIVLLLEDHAYIALPGIVAFNAHIFALWHAKIIVILAHVWCTRRGAGSRSVVVAQVSLQEKLSRLTDLAWARAPVQLPMWDEPVFGVPNELVRSALFNVRNDRGKTAKREYYADTPIYVYGEGVITYRGEELRQSDLDVWLQVLHYARRQPLGEWIDFTPYALLKAIGRPTSKPYYVGLRTHLSRMQASTLTFFSERIGAGITVSLIRKFEFNRELRATWRVWIEPEMRALFTPAHVSWLLQDQRRRLGPMAKWLHGFYASHAMPFPLKVSTLRQACGSNTKSLTDFRNQVLIHALDELVAIRFLARFWIEAKTDRVFVVRA